jgi:predicted SnoaL-like aldol condensation-catalyzing enzyme
MKSYKKEKIYKLLKGIETGRADSVAVVNEEKYIQHNPQTKDGGHGLVELFSRLAKTNPKVEIIRLFEDDNFVFVHTIYNFSNERVAFEIFRYEGSKVVEHWDNIQLRKGNMLGGEIKSRDLDLTEKNREKIRGFINYIFIKKEMTRLESFLNFDDFVEHSTFLTLKQKCENITYIKAHRFLAEGNFVLSVTEGFYGESHTSFYDLFRLENDKITEHWDTVETIPPKSEWENNNGKF